MKIYNEITFGLPRAKYVVESSGAVKSYGFMLNSYASLNLSKQHKQLQNMIRLAWQRGLRK